MIQKRSKCFCGFSCVWLVSLVLFADATLAEPRTPSPPHVIEVFISARHPMVETEIKGSGRNLPGLEITVYEIDGIQSVEGDLSLNLQLDPQQSKPIALQRIQRLDQKTRSRMQSAATGLSKAMQYGVNRYPAIVFDAAFVVYGTADLNVALDQYWAWQTRRPF